MTGEERRLAGRVPIAARLGARARATLNVWLLDLSTTGARILHREVLRPGVAYTLELPTDGEALLLSARVVRSTVVATEESPAGERQSCYESGVSFLGVSDAQRVILEELVDRLTHEGDLGTGRVTP